MSPRPRMRWSGAMDAGLWVFGGGLYEQVSVVDTDGTVTDPAPGEQGVPRRLLGR